MNNTETRNADRLLRVPDVMERLALSRSATYALLDNGSLPSVRLPGAGSRHHRRVRPADLEHFISANVVGAAQ